MFYLLIINKEGLNDKEADASSKAVNGSKYLVVTAIFMVVAIIAFNIVLEQFNLMVYPASVTAFSLETGETGENRVCRIEFLGEKVHLVIPDTSLLSKWAAVGHKLVDSTCEVLKNQGIPALQALYDRLQNLALEGELARFINIIESNLPVPLKELLQRVFGGL